MAVHTPKNKTCHTHAMHNGRKIGAPTRPSAGEQMNKTGCALPIGAGHTDTCWPTAELGDTTEEARCARPPRTCAMYPKLLKYVNPQGQKIGLWVPGMGVGVWISGAANGLEVSFWGDDVLELDGGDGCT